MKKILLIIALLTISGCIEIYEGTPPVLLGQGVSFSGNQAITETARELIAKVKGSIYESGETVSVFGSCLDSRDQPFSSVNASFYAWYPNGTQFINADNVTEIDPGFYIWTGPMNPVRGTYLTQLRCQIGNDTAVAMGEWQNPYWVKRINDTQQLVNVTIGEVRKNQELIENLTIDVETGFNETFTQINNTNAIINNSTSQIINNTNIIAQIANGSVDRNDSLIVSLLNQILTNGTPTTGPGGGNLSWVSDPENPVFFGEWEIYTRAFIGSNQVGNNAVSCFINTTNPGNPSNIQMQAVSSIVNEGDDEGDEVDGDPPWFYYSEVVRKRFDYDWAVWCVEN